MRLRWFMTLKRKVKDSLKKTRAHTSKPKEQPMPNLVIYSTPADAQVHIQLDDGRSASGGQTTANGRDDAHILSMPGDAATQGSVLSVTKDGFQTFSNRGIYKPNNGTPEFVLDDVHLVTATTPPPPIPEPGPQPPDPSNPQAVINWVYEQGDFDLSTHDGCGQFTEACCTALHDYNNSMWGHIKKNPGQNQYVGPSGTGHAVDALQCLAGPFNGIWDIIHDSVSPNATPSFNHKGPADPALWYYPA